MLARAVEDGLASTRRNGVCARSYTRRTRLPVRVLMRSFVDGWKKFKLTFTGHDRSRSAAARITTHNGSFPLGSASRRPVRLQTPGSPGSRP
jgi:hypothetical protein